MAREPENFEDYLTVGEAATLLGVSISTLRNWDRAGKLSPGRNPLNGYRLYKRADLERLLLRITRGNQAKETRAKPPRN